VFVRKNKNRSGSTTVQIIDKSKGKYQVIKTVGTSSDQSEIEFLWRKAHHMIPDLMGQGSLAFLPETDQLLINALNNDSTAAVKVTGPERVLGKIFDHIGFDQIEDEMFRHLVLARLICPVSKLKTTDFLYRYVGIDIDISKVYRFMDKLNTDYKDKAERIAFQHTKKILKNHVGIVFYDMTTLYFEAEYEDDFRKTGFSKDGKAQNPQVLLGLLVGEGGYPIGYQLFKGNTFEGHTLVPVLKQFQARYNLPKPIIIADAGLLSNTNIDELSKNQYNYILGARIKNESKQVKQHILDLKLKDGQSKVVKRTDGTRLIVSYAKKRAKKDARNRQRGLDRLEKKLKAGKLTKSHINNRGYNKYLKLTGEIKIEIDQEKFIRDAIWDGLKGYVTDTSLSPKKVIQNYNQLWQIEKAFRVTKNDLKVRPIFHRVQRRIEAHICISFCAYTVFKELERQLKLGTSPYRAIELTQTIYTLYITLPESQKPHAIDLPLDDEQKHLIRLLK